MRRLLICLAIIPLTTIAQDSQTLTLEEAVAAALRHSRLLKISASQVDAERSGWSEMRARLRPSLALAGSYNRIEEGAFRFSSPGLLQPFQPGNVVVNNYALRLGIRQPLFTGFRLSNAALAAEERAEAAGFELAMTEEDVVLQVARGYWSLFQTRRVHAYALRNVERLTSYLNDTRNLMDAGMATTNDLLKVEVQLSNAKVKEIEGRNGVRLSEIELNTVMGLPPEGHIELASKPDEPTAGDAAPDDRQGLDSLVQRALRRRGDLLAAEAMAEAAGAAVKTEAGAWWPQIDFTANYLYNNPHQRYQPLTEEFLGTWDVGVSFSLDLWNWGATTSRVERAEAQLRQAQLHQLVLRDQIVLEVHRVVLEVLEAKEKLSVAGLAVRQAEENLETTARKYRAGLTSTTELIDAEVSLLQTQTQLSGAETELAVALSGLRHAIGGPGATERK